MLRRQVSGSFVCLSCRLQLRGQAGFQRRPFALSARARTDDSQAAERQRILDGIASVEPSAAPKDDSQAAERQRILDGIAGVEPSAAPKDDSQAAERQRILDGLAGVDRSAARTDDSLGQRILDRISGVDRSAAPKDDSHAAESQRIIDGIAGVEPSAAPKDDSHAAERQRIIDGIAGVEPSAPGPDTPSANPKPRRPSNDDLFDLVLNDAEPNEPGQGGETLADKLEQQPEVYIQKYVYDKRSDGTLSLNADNNTVRVRGQRFRVGGESLPIRILGKPGSAIVMRSKGNIKRFVPAEQVIPEDLELNTDIADAIDTALDAEDEDHLLNIHELRQTDRTLTEVEFNALADTLLKGFTKAQLEEYLADTAAYPRKPTQEEVPQVPDPEWVVSRRPWVPDATEGARERGDIMRGYLTKSMGPKQRLVAEILRKRWNVSCDSVSANMGRLDVALRDVEFSLLLLGSKRWLRDITRNYLETGCQIEIIVASNTVSIKAPRTRSEVILQSINKVLSKSKTRAFDADLISPEPIDPGLLEDVGHVTNSIVRSSGRQIIVTWINQPEPAPGSEDLADVVFRYLLTAFHSELRTSRAVDVLPREQAAGGRYIANLSCQPQLPWNERRKPWARWVVASPARGEADVTEPNKSRTIPEDFLPHKIDILPADHGLPEPIKMPVPFSGDPIPVALPRPWSSDLITDTQAIFGQVLLEQPPNPSSPSSPIASKTLDLSLPRSFVPTLPPLTAFSFPNNIQEEGLWHTILVLQFLPSPSTPDAPPLELRIEADHVEIKRIVSLRAVTSSFVGDVCFPSAPVDLRLRQDRYFELPGDGIDVHAPAISEFLKAADLQPWAGKLATPPTLEGLMIPRRVLLGLSPDPSSSPEAVDAKQEAVQEPVEGGDVAVPEVEQDTVQETVEETGEVVEEAQVAMDEAVDAVEEAVEAVEEAEEAVQEAEEAVEEAVEEVEEVLEGAEEAVQEADEAVQEAADAVEEALEAVDEAVEAVEEIQTEEGIAHAPTEEVPAPDVAAEQDITQDLPEETPGQQETAHDTTPDSPSAVPDTTSPTTSPSSDPFQKLFTPPRSFPSPPRPTFTPKPEPDLVPVSYRFAGIEVQRVVTADYRGLRLGYRSVEAGQRGGKRSELVLRAAAAPPQPVPVWGKKKWPIDANAEAFLRMAAELAAKVESEGPSGSGTGNVFSWHGSKDREDGEDGYLYVR